MKNPNLLWHTVLTVCITIIVTLGLFLTYYSKSWSYLQDSSEACINCHVMRPYYSTWKNSSHKQVATCASCHIPQDGIFNSYSFKGISGLNHGIAFTFNTYSEAIEANEKSKQVIQTNCKSCHSFTNELISTHTNTEPMCWDCHREVPHGSFRGVSSLTYFLK